MKNSHNLMEKVENSQNEVGRTIRRIRLSRKMTADALAKQGSLKKSALLHYENGIRSVSEEALSYISAALSVPSSTLRARHIESVADAMQVLFQLERVFGLKPSNIGESVSFSVSSEDLAESIAEWQAQYENFISGKLTEEEYQDWQDRFPLQYNSTAPEQERVSAIFQDVDAEREALALSDARFKRSGMLRFRTHAMRALTGRNGSYVPKETLVQICQYVSCTEHFITDESCVNYEPPAKPSQKKAVDNQVLFDILGLMDKNADTEHFRVLQIQLSRIVLYHLGQKGFDREALRLREFVSDYVDYLYTGQKSKQHSIYVGFDYTQLDLIRETTGLSFEEMFTGSRT